MITIPLAFPLIPILWIAGILFGGAGVVAVAGAFKDPKIHKLGVLGMQGSGKTRFLSFLRNIPFKEGSTGRENYDSFKYVLNTKKEITIASGLDVGGGEMYRGDYNEILDESDVILYFFDIGKYLINEKDSKGESYQRYCNSRFQHIYSKIYKAKKPTLIIATHKDKCEFSEDEMGKRFNALIQNKSYKNILKEVEYVNLTDTNELENLKNKIFNT